MGGSLMVVIREEDGTVHKQERWDSSLCSFVKNVRLFRKDREYVLRFIESWQEEIEFYRVHEAGYLPQSYLAPLMYGLVVVDMQQNVILDMQGEIGLDRVSWSYFDKEYPDWEASRELRDNGYLRVFAKGSDGDYYKIITDPFALKQYEADDLGELKRMNEDLIELGFSLSPHDKRMWREFAKEQEEG